MLVRSRALLAENRLGVHVGIGLVSINDLVQAFNALSKVICEHIESLVFSEDRRGAFHGETDVHIPDDS